MAEQKTKSRVMPTVIVTDVDGDCAPTGAESTIEEALKSKSKDDLRKKPNSKRIPKFGAIP